MSINDKPLMERLQHAANQGDYYSDWIQEAHDRIAELEMWIRIATEELDKDSAIEADSVIHEAFKSLMEKSSHA